MPLLSTPEALHVSDSFLSSLYGDDIFRRWKGLKDEMKFITEREYVSWLIDVANHYRNEDESQQLSQETGTNQFTTSNVKSEEGLDYYNQGQGQSYDTPVSEEYSRSSTQDARNSQNYEEQFRRDTKVECEKTSVTSQEDALKCEQSYYDEGLLEMERNEEIILSSDDGGEGDGDEGQESSGTIDDGNGPSSAHLEVPWDSSSEKHTCPHCSYSSCNLSHIRRHVLAVHERHKPISCQYCDYRCSVRDVLKCHLILKHGFKSKFCCRNCNKYFHTPTQLQAHESKCVEPLNAPQLRIELDSTLDYAWKPSDERQACPHCSYSSRERGNLKRHIRAVHERCKPFSCQHCAYKCSHNRSLKSHLIYKHGYRSKYCCDNCHKYVMSPSHLRKHIKACVSLQQDNQQNILF